MTAPPRTALAVRRDPRLDARAAAAAVADEHGADLTWWRRASPTGPTTATWARWCAPSRSRPSVDPAPAATGCRKVQPAHAARWPPSCCAPTRPTACTSRCWARAASSWPATPSLPVPDEAAGTARRTAVPRRDRCATTPVRVAYMWVALPGAADERGHAGAGGRDAGQALAPGHRDHQGRDPAAVRDPAAGGGAGVVCAVARHQAAEPAAAAHPQARQHRPEPDRRARRARRGGAAGARHQRPAGAAGPVDPHAEALPGRRRAPAEDAAGRAAHAGRAGRARDRRRRQRRRLAEDSRCSRLPFRASARRTW